MILLENLSITVSYPKDLIISLVCYEFRHNAFNGCCQPLPRFNRENPSRRRGESQRASRRRLRNDGNHRLIDSRRIPRVGIPFLLKSIRSHSHSAILKEARNTIKNGFNDKYWPSPSCITSSKCHVLTAPKRRVNLMKAMFKGCIG